MLVFCSQGAEKLVWIPEGPTQSVEDGLRGSKASVEATPEGKKEDGATEILNQRTDPSYQKDSDEGISD